MNIDTQFIAWIITIFLNILWLFIFIPQLYINYKTKSSHAISLLLIFSLFLGEILSVVSAMAKELNIVIIFTIFYHIVLNLILICQIIYYRIFNQTNLSLTRVEYERLHDGDHETYHEEGHEVGYERWYESSMDIISINHSNFNRYKFFFFNNLEFVFIIVIFINIILFSLFFTFIKSNLLVTNLIAWIATLIFTLSRVPQIVLNLKRKSTEGLSLASFIILNITNLLFLSSILILLLDIPKEKHMDYIIHNLQWIIGVCSSFFMDLIIFYQFYQYRNYHVFL